MCLASVFLFILWLGGSSGLAFPPVSQDAASTSPSGPLVYSPVVLSQLCQASDNYCIYVDQIHPGTVQASPVNATDDQGAFLFQRSHYLGHPFRVCYGNCCIYLDFATKPGCVTMHYLSRHPGHKGDATGHLLARFADNVKDIVGPRSDMRRVLQACPRGEGQPLPYVVIGARSGHETRAQGHSEQAQIAGARSKLRMNPGQNKAELAGADANKPADEPRSDANGQQGVGHDYFDDVTVPLNNA